jgi:hypothetical protein
LEAESRGRERLLKSLLIELHYFFLRFLVSELEVRREMSAGLMGDYTEDYQ